jgi:glutaredoxin
MKMAYYLITSESCAPCQEMKMRLKNKGTEFKEMDIDTEVGIAFLNICKDAGHDIQYTPIIIEVEHGRIHVINDDTVVKDHRRDTIVYDEKTIEKLCPYCKKEYTISQTWNDQAGYRICGDCRKAIIINYSEDSNTISLIDESEITETEARTGDINWDTVWTKGDEARMRSLREKCGGCNNGSF